MSKGIGDRVKILEAENKELRRLWIKTEGDVIELRSYIDKKLLELDEKKQDAKVKGLANLIMSVHRKNGGIIREKRPADTPSKEK